MRNYLKLSFKFFQGPESSPMPLPKPERPITPEEQLRNLGQYATDEARGALEFLRQVAPGLVGAGEQVVKAGIQQAEQFAESALESTKESTVFNIGRLKGYVTAGFDGTRKGIQTLKDNGTFGDFTNSLQVSLNGLGYTEVGQPDGIYGNNTFAATTRFQSENGLQVDGIAGPKTIAKMEEVYRSNIQKQTAERPNIA